MKRPLSAVLASALLLALNVPVLAGPPVDVGAYRDVSGRIIGAAVVDDTAWQRLTYLCDAIGNRLSGTPQLDAAIAWAVAEMTRDGLENVHTEKAMVPRWVRGDESATLVEPVVRKLAMLGLGNSVGTPPEGITADVTVVHSFAELDGLGDKVRGRIVCYDVPFTNYGETVQYRGSGASRAAKYGAVAVLVRSVGPTGFDTPHTGALRYATDPPEPARIPAAAITIEGAEMLARMQARGQRIRVTLRMSAAMLADVPSANVVAELRGSEHPEQVVLLGAHLDSWDVGSGAHDDGGGCMQIWQALRILKTLGLRPRRTIRIVLFTNEENGLRGGTAYHDAHKDDARNHVLAIETDSGTFHPLGFGVSGSESVKATAGQIVALLEPIGAGTIGGEGGGADIGPMMLEGVPGMGLNVEGSRYFWYHHTNADTPDKIDPRDLALCSAAIAVMAYVVADLPFRIGE